MGQARSALGCSERAAWKKVRASDQDHVQWTQFLLDQDNWEPMNKALVKVIKHNDHDLPESRKELPDWVMNAVALTLEEVGVRVD